MTHCKDRGRSGQLLQTAFIAGFAFVVATSQSATAAPPGAMPFGAYDPGGDFSEDPEVSIEHLFLPWEDVFLPSLIDADIYAKERNRAILTTIEPWTWNVDERNDPFILRDSLLSGRYDGYMRAICAVLGTMESPITIRWAQEMDDFSGQFIWAQWEPQEYVAAFRRVVDVCRAEAPEINVMWSPLGFENLPEYYPGDDYVDLVGVSVFGLQKWEKTILGQERSFVEILTPRYERAVQFGKPVVVAELGYVGDQGYVDKWENEVRQIYPQFPRLVGVIYFNQSEVYPWPDGFGLPDWRINERIELD